MQHLNAHTPLVSTSWLAEHMDSPELVILHASFAHVDAPSTQEVIPNSLRLDLATAFCNLDAPQFRAMPTFKQFIQQARALGIQQTSVVVIYDERGVYFSPRAWWMFRLMGIANVYILDGGLPKWTDEGRPLGMHQSSTKQKGNIEGIHQPHLICSSQDVLAHLDAVETTIVDVRSEARFWAQQPEPRPGVKRGHIPGSINLPFEHVLNGHTFKSELALKALFQDKFEHFDGEYIFLCGSGVTACIVLVAAILSGLEHVKLYDGSWTQWGQLDDVPIVDSSQFAHGVET